jgi:alcohol dehydrogenase YqhD (iron-dependent ADH family)
VDTTAFIADRAYTVTKVRAVNTIAGTGGAASVDVKKCTGTQAPASGTTMLTAAFDLTTTANTVTTPTLTTGAVLTLAAGDRIALDFTGTLTSLVGLIEIFVSPA